ncbi:hypothetical protein [Microbacterium indicum]|uniref:hypothetical protein n=1 Tax=Microbacterium indicum TaxID=358100 RepID=UPI00048BF775|nr:hypothetical protein [Microbacterium indicum]
MSTAVAPPPARPALPHGVVRVRERVVDAVVREASAAAIGVARDEVSTEVSEWAGGLSVRVSARFPIPDLSDADAVRAATPIPDRARAVQSSLADTLARLTGREIRRVSVAITGAIVPPRKRVR